MEIEALPVDRQQQMESDSKYLKSERDRAEDGLDNDMHLTIDSSASATKRRRGVRHGEGKEGLRRKRKRPAYHFYSLPAIINACADQRQREPVANL